MNVGDGLIAVRFALYVDLMLVFGLPSFALYTMHAKRNEVGGVASPLVISVWSLAGAGLSVLGLLLIAATMSDVPLLDLDREHVDGLLNATAIGTAGKIRIAALVSTVSLGLLPAARTRVRWALQSAMGAVGLSSLAWTGHGAADDGPRGLVHLTADIVHLLAAGVWVGALAGLLLLIMQTRSAGNDRADRIALAGFATVGTIAVAAIVATGLVNSWFLVGFANIGALASSLYGRLLILKLAVFAGMVGLAGLNRFKLTPAITARGGSVAADTMRSIRRSVAVEASLAMIVLGLVAWIGTLAPPVSG